MRMRHATSSLRPNEQRVEGILTAVELCLSEIRASPIASDAVDTTNKNMVYTAEEVWLLDCYHALQNVHRLAIKCFLVTGDTRLAIAVYNQIFFGIRPR